MAKKTATPSRASREWRLTEVNETKFALTAAGVSFALFVLFGALSLVFVPFGVGGFGMMGRTTGFYGRMMGSYGTTGFAGMMGGASVLAPVLFWVYGALGVLVVSWAAAWVYNQTAKLTGGFSVRLEAND